MGDIIKPEDFNNLKAKISAECRARKYEGSVEEYAGPTWDYKENPATGVVIQKDHYVKLAIPLYKINGKTYGVTNITDNPDDAIISNSVICSSTLTEMNNDVDLLKRMHDRRQYSEPVYYTSTQEATGCNTSCTGMCWTTCTETCVGCTGDCGSMCTDACSSCSSSCSIGCGDICTNSCTSTCDNVCVNTCKNVAGYTL